MAFSFLHFLCSQIHFVFNGMIAGHFDFSPIFYARLCTETIFYMYPNCNEQLFTNSFENVLNTCMNLPDLSQGAL